jgi:DNA (cytosine-5)-methyltransferase 1
MDIAKLNGQKVSRAVDNLMPTPNTMDFLPARTPEQKAANKGKGGYANVRETVVNDLLPTPVASEGTKAPAQQTSAVKAKTGQVWLSNVAKDMEPALPTPTASDWKGANHSGSGSASSRGIATVSEQLLPTPDAYAAVRGGSSSPDYKKARGSMVTLSDQIEKGTNWGKFEPAIKRWEETLGRPAPAPTKPDGKDGAHRLSSAFTEWMMGVPEGWITGVGLTRNEELKACGNGVVPQQAEMALRLLLDGVEL